MNVLRCNLFSLKPGLLSAHQEIAYLSWYRSLGNTYIESSPPHVLGRRPEKFELEFRYRSGRTVDWPIHTYRLTAFYLSKNQSLPAES
jgi:hypothetical protein